MNTPDHPSKAIGRAKKPDVGKPPRTIRQQLEHDAWTKHYRMASRMAGRMARRPGQSGPGLIESGLAESGSAKNRRSLSRQDRTLLALSLVLLVLLLFARASAAQESVFDDAVANQAGIDRPLPPAGGRIVEGELHSSLLPVGSSVNLASFSSTSTGWKAQLVYSLATLFFAASLLWFSTPSRRVQAGGSPPLPT